VKRWILPAALFAFLVFFVERVEGNARSQEVSLEGGSSGELYDLMDKARSHAEQGRWFWACEAWQEALKNFPDADTARRRLFEALGTAEKKMADRGLPARERFYFETLRCYLLLDNASLWGRWQRLEKDPRRAEEARWFLWGPSADFYRECAAAVGWKEAAELYGRGWKEYQDKRWRAAAAALRESVRTRSDHFLAAQCLALCEARLSKDEGPGLPAPLWAGERYAGPLAGLVSAAENAFREGRWSLALAWMKNAPPSSLEAGVRERVRRAARRLEWMFASRRP